MSTKSLTIHDVPSFQLDKLSILADVFLSHEDELEYRDDHEIIITLNLFLDTFLQNLGWQDPDDESPSAVIGLIKKMKQVEMELTSHYIDGKTSERGG